MEIQFKHPELESGEKVYLVLHRHWIVFVKLVVIIFLMAIIPPIVYFLLGVLDNLSVPVTFLAVFGGIYYLMLTCILMTNWIDYYCDLFIITDRRIINIEQSALFNYKTSELLFGQIIDITAEKDGFLPMMFGFGSISIKTAAHSHDFHIFPVASPDLLSKEVKNVLSLHKSYDSLNSSVLGPQNESKNTQ